MKSGIEGTGRILYYYWNENSAIDIEETFQRLGCSYTKLSGRLCSYDADEAFEQTLETQLAKTAYDCIFTFNYFPIISKIAQRHQVPYIAWIYDCPHLTLYSHTLVNDCNYLFLFDREMHRTVCEMGAKHAYHQPLAVNVQRINQQLGLSEGSVPQSYLHEVSFVGSFYENNMYDQIRYLPDHLRGYLEGLIDAQQKVWGYTFFSSSVTEDLLKQISSYVLLEETDAYAFTKRDILVNMLQMKTSNRERVGLLGRMAETFPFDYFTGSRLPALRCGNAHGPISYDIQMPEVFYRSKININLSLRSISSGIPLRCLDILGAHGFLLSNYQPELAEYFIPGEDFVYFESEGDLMEKAAYYLAHDEERMRIAGSGWKKVQENFSYVQSLKNIFGEVFK